MQRYLEILIAEFTGLHLNSLTITKSGLQTINTATFMCPMDKKIAIKCVIACIAELQIKRQTTNTLLEEVKHETRIMHKTRAVLKKLNQIHIQQIKKDSSVINISKDYFFRWLL